MRDRPVHCRVLFCNRAIENNRSSLAPESPRHSNNCDPRNVMIMITVVSSSIFARGKRLGREEESSQLSQFVKLRHRPWNWASACLKQSRMQKHHGCAHLPRVGCALTRDVATRDGSKIERWSAHRRGNTSPEDERAVLSPLFRAPGDSFRPRIGDNCVPLGRAIVIVLWISTRR
jgi:hypothetical protein